MFNLRVQTLEADTLLAGGLRTTLREELCGGGGAFLPGCFALGVYENSSLLGFAAGRMLTDGACELVELDYRRALRPDEGEALLEFFEQRALLFGAERLFYTYSAEKSELADYARPFAACGWSEPVRRALLLNVETPHHDLLRDTKPHPVRGETMPLLELPEQLGVDYLRRHSKKSDYTCLGELVPALSLAYVEDGRLLGYSAFVQGSSEVEAVRVRLPRDKAAAGYLITQTAQAFNLYGPERAILRIESAAGEKTAQAIFGDRVSATQYLMYTEKIIRG